MLPHGTFKLFVNYRLSLFWYHSRWLMIAIFLCSFNAAAASEYQIKLSWDPVFDPKALGYRVYYGTESGNYNEQIDAGSDTELLISGLEEDNTYYIAVTTYDGSNRRSDYSEEITVQKNSPLNTGTISGNVTRESDNQPIADMRVCAFDYDMAYWTVCAQTQLDGSYTLTGLLAGNYGVRVVAEGTVYLGEHYEDTSDYISATPVNVVEGTSTSDIDFALTKGGEITGMMRDVDGLPINNISVYAEESTTKNVYSAETQSDGTYAVKGLPSGIYLVRAVTLDSEYVREYYNNAYAHQNAVPVTVSSGQTTPDIDFILAVGGKIAGAVRRDSDNQPVAGLWINAYDYSTGRWVERAQTQSDGSYIIAKLPDGRYYVQVETGNTDYIDEYYADSYDPSSAVAVDVSLEQTTFNIDISLASGGKITGIARRDSDHQPIAGLWVDAYDYSTGRWVERAQTQSDGSYAITRLPTGTYFVQAETGDEGYVNTFYDDTYDRISASPVDVNAGQTTSNIDFALVEGGKITGVVTRESDDQTIAGLWVFAYDFDTGRWWDYAQTQFDGSYTITGLSSGRYYVRALAEHSIYYGEYFDSTYYGYNATPVEVTVDQTTANIDFSLLEISGMDSDLDRLNYSDEIDIHGTDPYDSDTDKDGIYDGDEVVFWSVIWGYSWNDDIDGDGIYNLLDYDSDGDGLSDGYEFRRGSDPADPASAPGGVIAGTARDSTGVPITEADIYVEVYTGDTCNDPQFIDNVSTNPAHGTYIIEGLDLEGGPYYLKTNRNGLSYLDGWWANDGSSSICQNAEAIDLLSGGQQAKDFLLVADEYPVANNDTVITVEDTVVAFNVISNDVDSDGTINGSTVTISSNPANGSSAVNGNGTIVYTPNLNFNGTDFFSYTVQDNLGAVSNTAIISIVVESVNDEPIAWDDFYVVNEGEVLAVDVPGVVTNDIDAEGSIVSAILVDDVRNGTLTLNSDGSFIYTHNGGETASDRFTYLVYDGAANSNLATVTIAIAPENDTPEARDDFYNVTNSGSLNLSPPGVLVNDTDIDFPDDPLTAIQLSDVSNGILTFNSDGSFTYTPNTGFSGSDGFTYRVSDGTSFSNPASITILVGSTNTAPEASSDSYTINEGDTSTIGAPGVLENDTDLDLPEETLIAVLVGDASHGTLALDVDGSFTYIHDGTESVSDSFTYQVSDGTALSNVATVNLTISPTNDAPVAKDDAYSVAEDSNALNILAPGVLANDIDIDLPGDTLTAALVSDVFNGTLTFNADGSFTYDSNNDFTGTDSFSYKVSDGQEESNEGLVTITVSNVNDAPVLADIPNQTITEGASFNAISLDDYVHDIDTSDADLNWSFSSDGDLTVSIDGNRQVAFNTPDENWNGSEVITFTVVDSGLIADKNTSIFTVTPVNDPPVSEADGYTLAEGGTLNQPAPGVLENDSDVDGDALTAELVAGPAHAASFALNDDGSFSYSHDGSENLSDTFTYRASDGSSFSSPVAVNFSLIPVNDPPVSETDGYTLSEGGTLNRPAPGVLGNDSDPDSDVLTAEIVAGPAHAAGFALNADGSFSYSHDGSENLSDTFTYRASDGSNVSEPVAVTLSVTPVNDNWPVSEADGYTLSEGGTLNQSAPGVLGNDSDADGDALTAVIVAGPAHAAAFELNGDGSFSYSHDGSENLSDMFTYRASDGSNVSEPVAVSLSVTPINDNWPVSEPDGYTLAEGGTLNRSAPGVLLNDSDADGDALTAEIVAGPDHGAAFALNADGSFSYSHDGSENFSDTFTYRASDGSNVSSPVAVTLSVTPVNDNWPVSEADGYTLAEGGILNQSAPGVLGNDSDVDGDALTAEIVAAPAHAAAFVLNADGSFSYSHDGSENLSDMFTYRASDGSNVSSPVAVTLSVTPINDNWPVSEADGYTLSEGDTLNQPGPGVLGNDSDADGDALTAVIVAGPAHAAAFALNTDGSFSYIHDGSENFSDTFTYRSSDGSSDSEPVAVTLSVTPVNDSPVSKSDGYVLSEGGTLHRPAPGVLSNDSDADGDALTAEIVAAPAHAAAFALNADGSFSYSHDGSENISDTFTYRASDGNSISEPATVTFSVTPVTEFDSDSEGFIYEDDVFRVTLQPDYAFGEYSATSGHTGGGLYTMLGGVDGNDILNGMSGGWRRQFMMTGDDTVRLTLRYRMVLAGGYESDECSEVLVSVDGNLVNAGPSDYVDQLCGQGDGNPDQDTGWQQVIIEVDLTDGVHTLMVGGWNNKKTFVDEVTHIYFDDIEIEQLGWGSNNVIAIADGYTLSEGGALNQSAPGVLGNDSDVDGDALTAELVAGPAHAADFALNADGSFSYSHDGSENLSDTFTYRASDGSNFSLPVEVTLSVTPVNDPPVSGADGYTLAEGGTLNLSAPGVLGNDSDADGDALTAELVAGPAHAAAFALNGDGSFSYSHDSSENFNDTFTYRASDGSNVSSTVAVTLSVIPVNDNWPVSEADGYTLSEGGTLNQPAPGVLGNDSDIDGDALTAEIVAGPAHAAAFVLNADGSFSYSHDGSENLSDSFTYRASDGSNVSSPVAVTLSVTPVNDPPVSEADGYTLSEGGTLNQSAPGVLGNDSDADGDALTAEIVAGPAHAESFALNGDGSFSYSHDGSENLNDTFTYRASDGSSVSESAAVTLSVTPVNNNWPVSVADGYTLPEGGTLHRPAPGVLSNDSDADGDALTAEIVAAPAHAAAFALNGDGSFSYSHDGSENLNDTFTYRASDGSNVSSPVAVTLSVTPVNDPPVSEADGYTLSEGGTLNQSAPGVLGNDSDADGDALTAVIEAGPAHAESFALNGDGSFSYSHDGSENFSDTFSYRASDGSNVSSPVAVTLNVTPVNDNWPVSEPDGYTLSEGGTLNQSAPGVLGNDSDADGDALTAELVVGPAHAAAFALNADGSFIYSHDGSENFSDTFTCRASDGSNISSPVAVTLSVTPVAKFDLDSEGFVYEDDVFRGTLQPEYAFGEYSATGGHTGGGLHVLLGGVDGNDIFDGMSGGWRRQFMMTGDDTVRLTVRYRMVLAGGYESDECSEVLVSVNGDLVSAGPSDYVNQLCGQGDGSPDQDTGWQQVVIEVELTDGVHTLTVGGWNNKKTSEDEVTRIYFDDIGIEQLGWGPIAESQCNDGLDNDGDGLTDCVDGDCAGVGSCEWGQELSCVDGLDNDGDGQVDCADSDCGGSWPCDTLLSTDFDLDSEGFIYEDDVFRGTLQPAYAYGEYSAASGHTGGGLYTMLGGVDGNDILDGMSGGWSRPFMLTGDDTVRLTLRYRMVLAGGYESDECSEVLVSVDGDLVSAGPSDYVNQLCGQGDGSPDQDTGWQQVVIEVELTDGVHTLTVGGWNNKKTSVDEVTQIFFDDIEIEQLGWGPIAESQCSDGLDNDGDGLMDCADGDCAGVGSCEWGQELSCADGFDNDADGQVDCADSDCSGSWPCEKLLSTDFEVDSEGFIYEDDVFQGTLQPEYAFGEHSATGGHTGGGLHAMLGGVDGNDILDGMSGGWRRQFMLTGDDTVRLTLRYRMVLAGGYESDECSEVLVSVDGDLVSAGPSDYVNQLCGQGDGSPDQDTGWQQVIIEVELTDGEHTLTVGGWNNKKTSVDEFTHIYFDDIEIEQLGWGPIAESQCSDGLDNDGDGLTDCADGDCAGIDGC